MTGDKELRRYTAVLTRTMTSGRTGHGMSRRKQQRSNIGLSVAKVAFSDGIFSPLTVRNENSL